MSLIAEEANGSFGVRSVRSPATMLALTSSSMTPSVKKTLDTGT
jgi:hypothetical protein